MMPYHTGYMACHLGLVQDGRKGIRSKVEEEGGYRIPLPHPTRRPKIGANVPINVYHSVARYDQLHHPVDEAAIKPSAFEDLAEKGPVQMIIRLLKVQLKEDALMPRIPSKVNNITNQSKTTC